MEKLRFCTLAVAPFWLEQPYLFVESLRAFGGALAGAPFTILNPDNTRPLPDTFRSKVASLDAGIKSFEVDESALKFPLGLVPYAAAAAEQLTIGNAEILAFILPDTLILQPPTALLLEPGKRLCYRQVHHSNIGSSIQEAPDAFWSLIYKHCEVPEDRIFPMPTCTRDKTLRPYINAGFLVVRPEDGVLADWLAAFQRTYQHADFLPFFKEQRYAIFMHQAVLAGVMMREYAHSQLQEAPDTVNYPAHLHHEMPLDLRPARLNDLITCRYENLKELAERLPQIGVEPPLKEWLEERLQPCD